MSITFKRQNCNLIFKLNVLSLNKHGLSYSRILFSDFVIWFQKLSTIVGNKTVKFASETEIYFIFISDVFSYETYKPRLKK